MTKPGIAVDIWSDVMCPWCAVGFTQFAKAVDRLKGELEVEIRWMPFELNPDLPPLGKDQAKHLAEVYGRTPDQVAAMRTQMEATAERAGFPMTYAGEGEAPPAMMWNTFESHKLLRWALAQRGSERVPTVRATLPPELLPWLGAGPSSSSSSISALSGCGLRSVIANLLARPTAQPGRAFRRVRPGEPFGPCGPWSEREKE